MATSRCGSVRAFCPIVGANFTSRFKRERVRSKVKVAPGGGHGRQRVPSGRRETVQSGFSSVTGNRSASFSSKSMPRTGRARGLDCLSLDGDAEGGRS